MNEGLNKNKYFFDRETTSIIKGIAIIFMFVHHCFTFPAWWIEGIDYPVLADMASFISEPFKICVCMYSFLTGYFYYNKSAEPRGYKYSLKKITDILVIYWMFFFCFLILSICLGDYKYGIETIILEMFALERPVMIFCWYVRFYIVAMLILPIWIKFLNRDIVSACFFEIVFPVVFSGVIKCITEWFVPQVYNFYVDDILYDLAIWFPCITMGYIFSRFLIFERVFDELFDRNVNKDICKTILWLVMGVLALAGRRIMPSFQIGCVKVFQSDFYVNISMDIIYAPIFVYIIKKLRFRIRITMLNRILALLGKWSLYIWFAHCIFFNISRKFTQPFLYWPKEPILVLIWGLSLCCILVAFIKRPIDKIISIKNKWFKF